MKLLNYLAVMLFAFSVNAQNVINQTYLDVPLNKIGEFVDLHEKVTNASIGEGRTIARSFVYRHWYGSDHSIMICDIYASAEDMVKDDIWTVLGANIEKLPEAEKKEMQETVAKWWGYFNNHTDEVRVVDWQGNWYGKENLDLDNPYVFVVGSYNSSAGNQELIDAYMGWNVKPGVDDGVMWYGGATTHYIGSGSDVQVWAAYKNIADFAIANGPEGVRNSEYAGSFWNLVEGSHSDQIYVHVGNTRNAQGKFNRAGNDN